MADASVVYNVAYATGDAVATDAYTVAKIPAVNVASVTVINSKQVKVVFNKVVDSTTATNINNYYENLVAIGTGTAKAELQSDNKTVLITYAGAKAQGSVISYTVNGVKSADLTETTASTAISATFLDTTVPTIQSVAVTGNTDITITYSEQVNAAAANPSSYTLDGYDLTAFGVDTTTTPANGGTGFVDTTNPIKTDVVNFHFAVALPAGAHTLGVKASTVQDPNNFYVVAATQAISVTSDTTAPAFVSVTNNGLKTIDMIFSKPVKLPSIANITLNGSVLTGTVSHPDSTNLAKVELSNIVTVANGTLIAGANVVNIATGAISDYYGNTNAADIRFAVTASADVTPPTIASVTSANDLTVAVTYSETMNATAGNAANYAIKNAAGTTIATPASVATTDNTTYTLNFGTNHIPGGSYLVTATNVQDAAGNTIVATSKAVSVSDSWAPTVTSATLVSIDRTQVKLVFSEAMNYTTLTTLTSYQLNGVPVSTSTIVTPAADNTSVVLTFPTPIPDPSSITTILLKDVAGNFEASYQETSAVKPTTEIAPILIRATATNSTTIVAEYKNPLSLVNFHDFTYGGVGATGSYFQNVNILDTDGSTSVAGTKITLTFPAVDSAAAKEFKVVGNASHDALLNSIKADTIKAGVVVDKVGPQIASVTAVAGTSTVIVKYDESLQPGYASLYYHDFTVVSGGATSTLDSSTVASSTTGVNDEVVITLDSALPVGYTATVTPKTVPAYVQDKSGNLYVPNSTDLGGLAAGYMTTGETAAQAAIAAAAANKVAADAVTAKITALPAVVATTDEAAIVAARTAYTALTAAQQALVTNLAKLTKAETDLAAAKKAAADAAQAAADAAKALSDASTAVVKAQLSLTLADYTAANTLVTALAPSAAKDTLVAKLAAVKTLIDGTTTAADKTAADAVVAKIAAISTPVTTADEAAIVAARAAYTALTVVQQGLVTNLATLTKAETDLAAAKAAAAQAAADKAAADPVIAAITALPTTVATTDEAAIVAARAAYTALTAAQQALVTNVAALTKAETDLAAAKAAAAQAAADKTAADAVTAKIAALPTTVTVGDAAAITAARAAYAALTAAQQALVTNLPALVTAETALAAAQAAANTLTGTFGSMLGASYVDITLPAGVTAVAGVTINGAAVSAANQSIDSGILTVVGAKATDKVQVTIGATVYTVK